MTASASLPGWPARSRATPRITAADWAAGEPRMLGGGLGDIAPGQWSDDTEMACAIAGVVRPAPTCGTAATLDASPRGS